jgi:hypothetical protein
LAVVQGDHERGTRLEVPDAGEEARGGGCVERFGGLVEEQYVWMAEEPLGDAQAAALAAREGRSAGPDGGVEPRREGRDGVVVERGASGWRGSWWRTARAWR